MAEHRETPSGPVRRHSQLAAGGLALLAAAVLVTGCGKGDATPESVAGSAAPVSGDPTGTPTPGTSDGSAQPKTPDGGGKTPPGSLASHTPGTPGTTKSGGPVTAAGGHCHTSELKASVGDNDPGAGQENFALVLTNQSQRSCTVYGFPGLAFLNSAGQQVSVNPTRVGSAQPPVRLAPGGSAWAALSFGNPEITGVATVDPAAVEITPPDEKAPLKTSWPGGPVTNTGKASVPQVGSFQAGTKP
jgi:hypothetical protein